MAVLSNQAIVDALEDGRLTIDPPPYPCPGEQDSPYSTCSVDLRLDNALLFPAKNLGLSFDLSKPHKFTPTIERVFDKVTIPSKGYSLEPGDFVLGQTLEKVNLHLIDGKDPLAGRIEGRSRFARTGLLVHFTAPTIHAGYPGTITLELKNLGPLSIVLWPGLTVCQSFAAKR